MNLSIIRVLLQVKAKGELMMAIGERIRNVRWVLGGFILRVL